MALMALRLFFSFLLITSSAVLASDTHESRLDRLQKQLDQLQHQVQQFQKEIWTLKNQESSPFTTPFSHESETAPKEKAPQAQESNPKSLYAEAMKFLKERQFTEAEDALNKFIKNYPEDPLIVNVYYWRAEISYIQGNYPQAALLFGEAYETYLRQKGSAAGTEVVAKAPEIMLKLASSLASIGKYNDSKVILQEMEKEFKTIPGNIEQQAALLRREIARNTT